MRSSIRSDCASSTTRGSRLLGLLSMIITKVLGSGLLAQDSVAMRVTANILSLKTPVIPSEDRGALARRSESRDVVFVSKRSLRIGDFPQYRRALCTGSGGNIRRSLVPGLVRHEREGGSFLGFRG